MPGRRTGFRTASWALPAWPSARFSLTGAFCSPGPSLWLTLAVDLLPLRLGVKAVDVRIGSTIDQLFSPSSSLFEALDELGRLQWPLRFRINSGSAFRASAFCLATETLTVEVDVWPSELPNHDRFRVSLDRRLATPFPPWSAISEDPTAAGSSPHKPEVALAPGPLWQLPPTSATFPTALDAPTAEDVPIWTTLPSLFCWQSGVFGPGFVLYAYRRCRS